MDGASTPVSNFIILESDTAPPATLTAPAPPAAPTAATHGLGQYLVHPASEESDVEVAKTMTPTEVVASPAGPLSSSTKGPKKKAGKDCVHPLPLPPGGGLYYGAFPVVRWTINDNEV